MNIRPLTEKKFHLSLSKLLKYYIARDHIQRIYFVKSRGDCLREAFADFQGRMWQYVAIGVNAARGYSATPLSGLSRNSAVAGIFS